MIIEEFYRTREDGVVLNRTYSDIRHYIISDETGVKYDEAIDPADLHRTYTESSEEIPEEEVPEEN